MDAGEFKHLDDVTNNAFDMKREIEEVLKLINFSKTASTSILLLHKMMISLPPLMPDKFVAVYFWIPHGHLSLSLYYL